MGRTTLYALSRQDFRDALADLGGCAQGSRFFHIDIQNLRNITTSGAHAPYEVDAPLREILDPATEMGQLTGGIVPVLLYITEGHGARRIIKIREQFCV